ncbi:MAG TPA: hypothetical protein PLF13_06770 [candidate division Zixibacteria bacterium]|nr:hypothetical protein [candidate division Zixibacteria bacterium]
MKHLITVSLFVLFLVSAGQPCYAKGKALSKPSERHFTVKQTDWFIGIKGTGGKLVGDATERIQSTKDEFWFGWGLEGEYFFSSRIGVGGGIGYTRSVAGGGDAFSYSIHGIARFTGGQRSFFFAKPEYGKIRRDSEYSYEYSFLAFGIGHNQYTGPTTSVRAEIYVNHFFSKESNLYAIKGVDVTGVGITLGFYLGFN